MKKTISKYWLCQIGGWSAYIIVFTFFYLTLRNTNSPYFFENVFLDAFIGVAITHVMRLFIRRMRFLQASLDKQILDMVLTTAGFSFLFAFISIYTEELLHITTPKFQQLGFSSRVLYSSFGNFMFLIIWNLIYFTFHFIMKSQQEQLDKVKLQSLVKEL